MLSAIKNSPRINNWFLQKKRWVFINRKTISFIAFALFVGISVGITFYFITNPKNNEKFNQKDKVKKPSKDSHSESSNDQYASERAAYEKGIRAEFKKYIGTIAGCDPVPDGYVLKSKRKNGAFSKYECLYKHSEAQIQDLMKSWDNARSNSNYSSTENPNAEGKLGCPYTLGLTTSDANEDAVKNTCDLDPKCVGYYKGSTGWSVATQIPPKDCKKFSGDAGYKEFMMKVH